MNKNIIILLVIIGLILVFGGGFFSGQYLKKCATNECATQDPNDTYQAGWEAAKKALQESGLVSFDQGKNEIKNITGTVVKTNGNIFEVKIIPVEILGAKELEIRNIEVAAETEIIKIINKDSAVFQKEWDAFIQKHPEYLKDPINTDIADAPSGVIEENGQVSDLTVGSELFVESEEDIRTKKDFIAKKIIINIKNEAQPK
jgi:hypothetical protein